MQSPGSTRCVAEHGRLWCENSAVARRRPLCVRTMAQLPTCFSTFRILPRSGSTAWYRRSRACLVLPPAGRGGAGRQARRPAGRPAACSSSRTALCRPLGCHFKLERGLAGMAGTNHSLRPPVPARTACRPGRKGRVRGAPRAGSRQQAAAARTQTHYKRCSGRPGRRAVEHIHM